MAPIAYCFKASGILRGHRLPFLQVWGSRGCGVCLLQVVEVRLLGLGVLRFGWSESRFPLKGCGGAVGQWVGA